MLGEAATLGGHDVTLIAVEVLFALVCGAHVLLEPPGGRGHKGAQLTGDSPLSVVHLT